MVGYKLIAVYIVIFLVINTCLLSPSSLASTNALALQSVNHARIKPSCSSYSKSNTALQWSAKDSSNQYIISPSLLSAEFTRLGEEVDNVLAAGADVVHFDCMDNHYVPNLTMGPLVCKALRDHGVTKDIDVHLMVEPVDAMIQEFVKAGASYISFHPESSKHVDRSLSLIRSAGLKAGLVLNPSTSLETCRYVMDKLDILLLTSTNPGFGGQTFIPQTIEKTRLARQMIDASGYDVRLMIDGGVGMGNIRALAEAGANMFVAGSAILKAPRTVEAYKATIQELRDEIKKYSNRY